MPSLISQCYTSTMPHTPFLLSPQRIMPAPGATDPADVKAHSRAKAVIQAAPSAKT